MRRSRTRAGVVLPALVWIVLACLLGAGHASAEPASAESARGQASEAIQQPVIDRVTAVPSTGKVSCYGYTGTFRAATNVVAVNWARASDECFGIATDRTIWHAWRDSGGWHKMPGGGYADSIAYLLFREDTSSGYRQVVVYTLSSDTYWCQDYGWLGGWDAYWFAC